MENLVRTQTLPAQSDSGYYAIREYTQRFPKRIWPEGFEDKIAKALPFYHVMEWTTMDFNKKDYGVGFLAALAGKDDFDLDIKEIEEVIRICFGEKQLEYKQYYELCLPILSSNMEKLTRQQYKTEKEYARFWNTALEYLVKNYSSSPSQPVRDESEEQPAIDPEASVDYTSESGFKVAWMLSRPSTFYSLEKKIRFSDGTTSEIYKVEGRENYWGGDAAYSNEADAAAAEYFYKKHNLKRKTGQTERHTLLSW